VGGNKEAKAIGVSTKKKSSVQQLDGKSVKATAGPKKQKDSLSELSEKDEEKRAAARVSKRPLMRNLKLKLSTGLPF
jgi:hypothetical protein